MLSSTSKVSKTFDNFFDELDIFKIPVNLLINDKAKTSTYFGKIFSLICLIYVVISFFNSDLMQKTNPNILIQDIKLNERFPLKIGKKDLSLAIGLSNSDKEYEYDEKIFKISAFVFYQDIRNKSKSIRNFEMHLCQESDFEDHTLFLRLNLNGTLCLPEEVFELKGFWDEIQIQFLKIEISVCRNNSENYASCYSDEIIKDYFTKQERLLAFYVNDINIDASSSKDQPFTNKLSSFYFSMDINLEKRYEIYLKQTDISTTDGLIFQDTRTFSTIQIDKIKSDINNLRPNANLIGCLFFLSSDLNTNIARRYQNLQEACGTMSGIFNFLMLMGMIFANFENNFRITRDLTSKLYVFQNLDKFEEKKKDGKIHAKNDNCIKSPLQLRRTEKDIANEVPAYLPEERIAKRKSDIKIVNYKLKGNTDETKKEQEMKNNLDSNSKKNEDINQKMKSSQNITKIEKEVSVQKEKNLENFEKFKHRKQKFNFGFIKYLRMKLKFNKKSLKNEEKLFMKSQQQIYFEMDIIHILRKIQEIEKLKKILLNENEQYLFNLLDKPFIHLEKQELRGETEGIDFKRKSLMVNSFQNLDFKKEHIIENYRKVRNSKSVVGNRLLKLMDQDVFMFVGNEHFQDVHYRNETE